MRRVWVNIINMSPKPLTIKQLRQYPPETLKVDSPPATSEGSARVAQGRKPFSIHYKTFGHGPTRMVWISAHGAGVEDWYDFVRVFGVENADRYTSLIFENRWIGQSRAPWSVCSMKDMARDTVDLLRHIGWTEERSVNVIGHSMGGMIAIELASDPSHAALLRTLTLISTTTNSFRDLSLLRATKQTLQFLIPKSADSQLSAIKAQLFSPAWLTSSDSTGIFPTNGDRWAARSLSFTPQIKAEILQTPGTVRFKVKDRKLTAAASRLGKAKILITHGWDDQIIPVAVAEKMWEGFGGRENGVKIVVLDGVGHCPHVEATRDVISLIEGMVNANTTTS